MPSNEIALMKEIQIAASEMGARLFRQQVGQGWIGKSRRIAREMRVSVGPGDVIVSNARPFHTGFEGWSDLGGWVPVLVRPDMIGQTMAVYLQAEVKDRGRATDAQMRWIDAVNRAGGIAGVVRSHDDIRALLTAKSGSTE